MALLELSAWTLFKIQCRLLVEKVVSLLASHSVLCTDNACPISRWQLSPQRCAASPYMTEDMNKVIKPLSNILAFLVLFWAFGVIAVSCTSANSFFFFFFFF
ncbi:unnamed protein product [Ixodes persulcatus]